jgi:hypothetical protein
LLVVLALAVVLLAGCQVQVQVDAVVDKDGAGTVTVSVGFDAAAWARLQEREPAPLIDDLRQASWEVTDPETGADGTTWVRATKAFSSSEQLAGILAEISATPMIRDLAFTRVETDDDITYRVTGSADLTQGMATFAEPELAAQLNGDPFGGNIAAIEAEEGKPVSEMVSFEFTTTVAGGAPSTVRPTLRDTAPVPIDVSTVELKPPSFFVRAAIGAAIVVGIVVVGIALVGVRRRMAAGR